MSAASKACQQLVNELDMAADGIGRIAFQLK
jgi:hypothetical protein